MKFIVDQQLPPVLVEWLKQHGYQADHVRNIGLRDAPDGDIWERAIRDAAAILTKDQDFATRRRNVEFGPRIVWLRCGNATTATLTVFLERNWRNIEAELRQDSPVIEVR